MNKVKITYYVSTLICCGIMAFSASMYFTKTEMIKEYFNVLQYPTYVVIPLAIAKVLGIIAIISRKSQWLKEWAYAGFVFDGIFAAAAHINANDGGYIMAIVVVVASIISYFLEKKIDN